MDLRSWIRKGAKQRLVKFPSAVMCPSSNIDGPGSVGLPAATSRARLAMARLDSALILFLSYQPSR